MNMEWTTQAPQSPGFYWARGSTIAGKSTTQTIVEVFAVREVIKDQSGHGYDLAVQVGTPLVGQGSEACVVTNNSYCHGKLMAWVLGDEVEVDLSEFDYWSTVPILPPEKP